MMIQWNTKNRLRIILGGGFILFIIVYQMAIKPTIICRREYMENSTLLASVDQAPARLSNIRKEIEFIDNEIGLETQDEEIIQKELLKTLGENCKKHKLVLKNFSGPVVYTDSEYKINTLDINVNGSFKNLLKLLRIIEELPFGEIISTGFQTTINKKTREKELILSIQYRYMEKSNLSSSL